MSKDLRMNAHRNLRIIPLSFPICLACLLTTNPSAANAQRAEYKTGADARAAQLLQAYPEHLERIEAGQLIWKDGTRLPFDDGQTKKSHRLWLIRPDIEDMLRQPYPLQPLHKPPPPDFDPGRARNQAFFTKMYGDCRTDGVKPNLVDVVWMRNRAPQKLKVTRINNVARALQRISDELETLPEKKYAAYLSPAAGTFNCRVIAGTNRLSAHAFGIAIDIAIRHADYWRWTKRNSAQKAAPYRNKIPYEIVEVFERHGFIWGGKWYHYDTMHFEYRPELLTERNQ